MLPMFLLGTSYEHLNIVHFLKLKINLIKIILTRNKNNKDYLSNRTPNILEKIRLKIIIIHNNVISLIILMEIRIPKRRVKSNLRVESNIKDNG